MDEVLPSYRCSSLPLLPCNHCCWMCWVCFFPKFPAAKPGPAIGQALGPLGINMAQFCKEFNEKSETLYEKETPLRVELRAMSDRSYTFEIRSPPTAWLVKRAAGVDKGPNLPSVESPSGFITPEMVYHIALIKQADDNRWHIPLEGIARSVIGTARSIGIKVREEIGEADETKK
jgi:large subunit ribosomal protein L11